MRIEEKKEIWKDVTGYENFYKISNKGKIMCKSREKKLWHNGTYMLPEKILRPSIREGYLIIVLTANKKRKTFSINRLVATEFIPNPDNLPEVNHLNGDKLNNNDENLEWSSKSDNINHAYKILKRKASSTGKKIKSVIQVSLDGFIIEEYNSINIASVKNNGTIPCNTNLK